jgi:aryl-alcohol dehydrogenase-like predicted oxidoreductase
MERAWSVVKDLNLTEKVKGMTIGQIAIAFCLSEPSVTTVLPNFTKEEEITEWTKAADKKLSDDIIKEAKKIYYERLYPYVVMRES